MPPLVQGWCDRTDYLSGPNAPIDSRRWELSIGSLVVTLGRTSSNSVWYGGCAALCIEGIELGYSLVDAQDDMLAYISAKTRWWHQTIELARRPRG